MIQGKGSVPLRCFHGSEHKDLIATDVFYVPNLEANLLSVSTSNKKGFDVIFDANGQCKVTSGEKIYVTGFQKDGIYQVHCKQPPPDVSLTSKMKTTVPPPGTDASCTVSLTQS